MLRRTFLSGTEERTVEITGRLDPARACVLAGPSLSPRVDEAGAEVGIVAFRMRRLAPRGLAWAGASYGEVLFRLGVTFQGAPAWLALLCVLDHGVVAALARSAIRYPIRLASRIQIATDAGQFSISAEGPSSEQLLDAAIEPLPSPMPEPSPVRPMLVVSNSRLMRIPWDETPAPRRIEGRALFVSGSCEQQALGSRAVWTSALVHEGRIHHCGFASAG